jgi:hypothetical protein
MTAKQEREHKLGNQLRKLRQQAGNHKPVGNPAFYFTCQNGRYTEQAKALFKS